MEEATIIEFLNYTQWGYSNRLDRIYLNPSVNKKYRSSINITPTIGSTQLIVKIIGIKAKPVPHFKYAYQESIQSLHIIERFIKIIKDD